MQQNVVTKGVLPRRWQTPAVAGCQDCKSGFRAFCSKSRDLVAMAICDSNHELQISGVLRRCESLEKSSILWLDDSDLQYANLISQHFSVCLQFVICRVPSQWDRHTPPPAQNQYMQESYLEELMFARIHDWHWREFLENIFEELFSACMYSLLWPSLYIWI